MILESRVDQAEINEEIQSAVAASNPAGQMAVDKTTKRIQFASGRAGLQAGVSPKSDGLQPLRSPLPRRIRQLHVSEVNTESRHDRLSLESILTFQKVCQLVPPDVPMILESRVDQAEINEEIQSALAALNPAGQLAVASALRGRGQMWATHLMGQAISTGLRNVPQLLY